MFKKEIYLLFVQFQQITNIYSTSYGCQLVAVGSQCNSLGTCQLNGNCICNFGYTGTSCETTITTVTTHNYGIGKGSICLFVLCWMIIPFVICFIWYLIYVRCMDKDNYNELSNELSEGCCCCRAFNKIMCKKCCFPCCRKGCKRRCGCCWPQSDPVAQDPLVDQQVNIALRLDQPRTNNQIELSRNDNRQIEVLPPVSNPRSDANLKPADFRDNRGSSQNIENPDNFTDDVDGMIRAQNYYMDQKNVNKQTPLTDSYLKSQPEQQIPPMFQIPELDKPHFASLKSSIKYKVLLDAIQDSMNQN